MLYTGGIQQPSQPVAESGEHAKPEDAQMRKIAQEPQPYGLTLVKTVAGYSVVKLEVIQAQDDDQAATAMHHLALFPF
jgi:hypothetical protein